MPTACPSFLLSLIHDPPPLLRWLKHLHEFVCPEAGREPRDNSPVALPGIAAILGMAVGMYVGIHSATRSLFATREHEYRTLHMADVTLRFVPDDLTNVPHFSDIPGVAAWEARLVAPGQPQCFYPPQRVHGGDLCPPFHGGPASRVFPGG
jgi:hypothetical protein